MKKAGHQVKYIVLDCAILTQGLIMVDFNLLLYTFVIFKIFTIKMVKISFMKTYYKAMLPTNFTTLRNMLAKISIFKLTWNRIYFDQMSILLI